MNTTLKVEVEKIEKAPHDPDIRIIRRVEVGSVPAHQGDIYIHCVAATHPRGKAIAKGVAQIALGTGNGARHIAKGKIKVYEGEKLPDYVRIPNVDGALLLGPLIEADEPWVLEHPEHAHFQLPAGTYQTTYQYDPRTMQRVQD